MDIEAADAAIDINNTSTDPLIHFQVSGTTNFTIGTDVTDSKFKIGTTALETGTAVTVQSTGEVGIGTTSPTKKLHITGDGGNDAAIKIQSTNSSGAGFMYMQRNTDGKSYVLNASNQALILGANNNTSQLYLKENGNVGIGTTAPATKLQVGNMPVHSNSRVWDANTPLALMYPTVTSNTVLNDPKPVLILGRDGTSSEAYGALATFNLSRYENNSTNSRTRLDLALTKNNFVKNIFRSCKEYSIATNPESVLIFPEFLETLPENQLKSGYAEVVKHALISDNNLWEKIISVPFNEMNWGEIIETSINIKNKIVLSDPYEKGERKKLNFGHTFGHAVESYYLEKGTPILHGEAVLMGILLEVEISLVSQEQNNEIKNYILSNFSLPFTPKKSDLLPFLMNDKKNKVGKINFSLLTNIGSCSVDNLFSVDEL